MWILARTHEGTVQRSNVYVNKPTQEELQKYVAIDSAKNLLEHGTCYTHVLLGVSTSSLEEKMIKHKLTVEFNGFLSVPWAAKNRSQINMETYHGATPTEAVDAFIKALGVEL